MNKKKKTTNMCSVGALQIESLILGVTPAVIKRGKRERESNGMLPIQRRGLIML